MAQHGGAGSKYTTEGCRCPECTQANTDRVARRRKARRPEDYNGEHGKPTVYSNWNCRCDACREAWRVRCAGYYANRKRPFDKLGKVG